MRYARPTSMEEALDLLAGGRWRLLAGGTDFYPAHVGRPIGQDVLDINGLEMLRGIAVAEDTIRIGARTSWTDLLRADLPPAFDGLKLAAREVGSIQIQNAGTVAGNLCNASPAADGVPPLLSLDAEVEVQSASRMRKLSLTNFILGNRSTALADDEMVTAVCIPRSALPGRSHFIKLGARRYLVISIAMAAAALTVEDGRIADARLALGACSAVATRMAEVERALAGQRADEATIRDIVAQAPMSEIAPIDDVRASAGYRGSAAREIAARALIGALGSVATGQVAA